MFTVRENTWPRQYSPIVGWVLLLVLVIMVLTSLPVMRRTGNFEIFYYCHSLYVVFYVLLIIHAPKFWYWLLIPGSLFVMEALNRIRNSFGSHGRTYIEKGVILPSRVVHLVIKRPPNFHFSSGDWVFIQIPEVAKTEWHPFTISSAPEMDDVLWLHIRAVGQWTNRVYDYFQVEEDKLNQEDGVGRGSKKSRLNFDLPIRRGKSYPPASLMTKNSSPEISPICPPENNNNNNHFSKPPNPFFQTNGVKSGTVAFNLSRMASTPVPHPRTARPSFDRALSMTIEPLMKIPFDRRMSKIYVLPRPSVTETRRRRLAFMSTRASSKPVSDLDTVVEEGEVEPIEADSSSLDLTELIQINASDSPHALLQSGRIIKLEKPLHLHIDGPYGSPTSHIFHTEHAILIGTGIGVTPFASILQSIMYRFIKTRHTCPSCHHTWSDAMPSNVMNLKKVDFVWINRNQRSFEWFVSLLSQLESNQAMLDESDRFLDIHMYITSAAHMSDVKEIGMGMMQENRDLLSGLRARTHAGRPQWDSFFKEMSLRNKGRVTVFYCGAPELGRIIHGHCIPFGFYFRKENF